MSPVEFESFLSAVIEEKDSFRGGITVKPSQFKLAQQVLVLTSRQSGAQPLPFPDAALVPPCF